MKLYEFDFGTNDETVLSGVVGMILNRIKDTGYKNDYSLKTVLGALQDRGLDVDEDLFVKMSQNSPLNNIIDHIDNGKIIFKGQSDGRVSTDSIPDEQDEAEQQADTLERMAKRATKKRES